MTKEEWEDLIFTSDYLAGVEIQKCLEKGEVEQAKQGLQMLLETQKMWQQLQLKWKLRDLMFHVLSGIYVPQKRTRKWHCQLMDLRDEFRLEQEDLEILNDEYVRSVWQGAYQQAKRNAEILTDKKRIIKPLTWEEVFDKRYTFRG